MFIQKVLNWILPQEKSEKIGEKSMEKCIEPPEIPENTAMQSIRTQLVCPSTGPDRNIADEIEKELLKLHEQKLQVVTFLGGGDVCLKKQQHPDKKIDITQTDNAGIDVIEHPREPKLSPLCKRIFQEPAKKKPSRRSVFTQTDRRQQRRKSVKRNSSASRVEQKNKTETSDGTMSNNNQRTSKEKVVPHNFEGSTEPKKNSPKKTKATIDIHSSESPKELFRSGTHSPEITKNITAIYSSECSQEPLGSEIHSSCKTKDITTIHNSESPKEQLKSVNQAQMKVKKKIAFHNYEGTTKPQTSSPKKTTAAISIHNSDSPKESIRSTVPSPKRTKEIISVHSPESLKEHLKSVIYSAKRTKEVTDIHSSAIPSPESERKQMGNAINPPKNTKEKITVKLFESSQELLSELYSPKKTNENVINHKFEGLKETLASSSSSDTEAVDLLSGQTSVSPKSEKSVIPSHVLTLLQEVAEQYPKEMSMDSGVYGELLVLGTSNRFVLRKRIKANGVKEATSISSPKANTRKHTVSFQVSSASRPVVVQYVRDPTSDMFQVGRHDRIPVDICVTNSNGRKGVSRFACRLVIKRQNRHDARLYAAAFDASGNVFLGESGACETDGDGMDGFTTNGVLLLQPGGEWREVSVRGRLYSLRTELGRRKRMETETNVLRDGSLIDLCGVTLLWRTLEGILDTPGKDCLVRMEDLLRELAPVCHNKTRSLNGKVYGGGESETFVFLSCGHAVSMEASVEEGMICPECGRVGSVTSLRVGKESGFYTDRGMPPSHAFRPCGHVSTHGTARFWSGVGLPHDGRERGICPFCATRLHPVHKYVGLVYPRHCHQ